MSLFGGDSNSNSNTFVSNYQATLSPVTDTSGASGSLAVTIAPQAVGGGTFGAISPQIYNAPVNINATTDTGDSAIAAQAAITRAQMTPQTPQSASSLPSWLTDIFTEANLPWLIGAVVILYFFRGHA